MKYKNILFSLIFGMSVIGLVGCSSVSVVPEELEDQINPDISFLQLREAPLNHKGATFVLGGQVLSARRLEDSTQIVVLQLPLNHNSKPNVSLQHSQGRFIAIEKEFLDPATLPTGTLVTVVGEVSGMVTLPLDETTYDYPTLVIHRLTIWSDTSADRVSPHYPYGYPYWGPYWFPYRGPYWWWF